MEHQCDPEAVLGLGIVEAEKVYPSESWVRGRASIGEIRPRDKQIYHTSGMGCVVGEKCTQVTTNTRERVT